jgi:lipopolysaccharide/colanic/teichoic acid biosynthesis glycosyltransferase
MSAENPIKLRHLDPDEYKHIDFSFHPEVEKMGREIMGGSRITKHVAKTWIQSPTKQMLERAVFKVFSIAAHPLIEAAKRGVERVDGPDSMFYLRVGLLGENYERVGLTYYPKIRTLVNGASDREKTHPLHSPAFTGSRRPSLSEDDRTHSKLARTLRRTHFDESPQLGAVARNEMVGIGLRGYSEPELEGLTLLFHTHETQKLIFPNILPPDYRQVVSDVQPTPGAFGLYSAIYRKGLTITERLFLDRLYLVCANPWGDMRIVTATAKSVLRELAPSRHIQKILTSH